MHKEAIRHYKRLTHYSKTRTKEISEMSEPYIIITDSYGHLISRIVLLLGGIQPQDIQDIVVRDLMADIFDFLYESRFLILSGKLNVAFPIARRAYEALSLLHLCTLITFLWNAKRMRIGSQCLRVPEFYIHNSMFLISYPSCLITFKVTCS